MTKVGKIPENSGLFLLEGFPKMSGMIALRTITYFLLTSLLAAIVGLAWVLIIHPGDSSIKSDLDIDGTTDREKTSIVDTFLDLGRNLVPDNLFQATFQSVSSISLDLVRSFLFSIWVV